jgi:hypothetical protein
MTAKIMGNRRTEYVDRFTVLTNTGEVVTAVNRSGVWWLHGELNAEDLQQKAQRWGWKTHQPDDTVADAVIGISVRSSGASGMNSLSKLLRHGVAMA